MTEVANPIPQVNQVSVMRARRNTLMNELLRIAPLTVTPQAAYKTPEGHKPKVVTKQETVKKERTAKKEVSKERTVAVFEHEDQFANNPQLYTINGIHIDLYDYFGVNADAITNDVSDRLRFIHDWVLRTGKSFRDGLMKLNRIDIKLGAGDEGESKVLKMYNWLRLRGENS